MDMIGMIQKIFPYKGFSRKQKKTALYAVEDYAGKRYLQNPVDAKRYEKTGFFVEQSLLINKDNIFVNNAMPRLNHNIIYYAADLIVPVVAATAVGTGVPIANKETSAIDEIIVLINNDVPRFRKDFVVESNDNRISQLDKILKDMVNAKTDSVSGILTIDGTKCNMGSTPAHYKKLQLIEKKITGWVDDLTADEGLSYLLNDYMRSVVPGQVNDKATRRIFLPDERKKDQLAYLLRELVPKRAVKGTIEQLKKELSVMEKIAKGKSVPTAELTKAAYKELYAALKAEDAQAGINSLKSKQHYAAWNEKFVGDADIALSKRSTRPLTLTVKGDTTTISSMEEFVNIYFDIKKEIGDIRSKYIEKPARTVVGDRVKHYSDAAAAFDDNKEIVKHTYDVIKKNMTAAAKGESGQAVDTISDSEARKNLRVLIDNKYDTIVRQLSPESKRQLKKSPFTRMETIVAKYYNKDSKLELQKDVTDYINLVKFEDFVRSVSPESLLEKVRCKIQDIFYRRARKQDAYHELYHI